MRRSRARSARLPTSLLLLLAASSLRPASCAEGQVITAVVGTAGTAGNSPNVGLASSVLLNKPYGVAVDWRSGDLLVSDTYNHRIRRVTSADGLILAFAGTGTLGYTGDGGAAINATLNFPQALFITTAGLLYFTDTWNHAIRLVSLDGLIHTIAGTGTSGNGGSGVATKIQLNTPSGVTVSPLNGDVIFSDTLNHKVRRVTSDGAMSTIAGTGFQAFSGDGGPATRAQLCFPFGVAVDPSGVIFFADRNNCRVRRIGLNGNISSVAGNSSDNVPQGATANTTTCLGLQPVGLAVDLTGHLYVADVDCTVRVMDTTTYALTTLSGNLSTCGFNGNNQPALTALLNSPFSVALGPSGDVFVADTDNNQVRRIAVPSLPPPPDRPPSPQAPPLPLNLEPLPLPGGAVALTPTLSTAAVPPSPRQSSAAPTASAAAAPAGHSLTGAIAGGVVGGVLAISALTAGLVFVRRRQRGRQPLSADHLTSEKGGGGASPSVFLSTSGDARKGSSQLLLARRSSSLAPSSGTAATGMAPWADANFARAEGDDGDGSFIKEARLKEASATIDSGSTLPSSAPSTWGYSDSVQTGVRGSVSSDVLAHSTPSSQALPTNTLSSTWGASSSTSSVGVGVRAVIASSGAFASLHKPLAVRSVPEDGMLQLTSADNSQPLFSSREEPQLRPAANLFFGQDAGSPSSSWGASTDMRVGVGVGAGVGTSAMPSHKPAPASQPTSWANSADLNPVVVSAVHALPNNLPPLRVDPGTPTSAATTPFTPALEAVRATETTAASSNQGSPHHHEAASELHARILKVADSDKAAPAGSSRTPQASATQLVGAAAKMNVGGVWWTQGALIDQGGNGSVYCGHDREGALIAIKVQKMPEGTDQFGQDLLLQELRALQKLKHRNVVEYLGSAMDDTSLYIFMSHEPQSLARLLKDGLDESIVRKYTRQILQGLEYVHSQGIWHRDIKAANVLIGADGVVLLTDFGSAKIKQPTDITSNVDTIAGTPHWMSPEICLAAVGRGQGQGYSGVKADVWSLGVTVVEMMMGGHPWCKMDGLKAIWQVVNNMDGLPRPKHASPMALEFLDMCLQRDPDKRSSVAQLLAHPFVTVQDSGLSGGIRRLTPLSSPTGSPTSAGGPRHNAFIRGSPSDAAQPRASRLSSVKPPQAAPSGATLTSANSSMKNTKLSTLAGSPMTPTRTPPRWS